MNHLDKRIASLFLVVGLVSCSSGVELQDTLLVYDQDSQELRAKVDVESLTKELEKFPKKRKGKITLDFTFSGGWQIGKQGEHKGKVLVGKSTASPLVRKATYEVKVFVEQNLLVFNFSEITSKHKELKDILESGVQSYKAADFADVGLGEKSYFSKKTSEGKDKNVLLSPEAGLNVEGVVFQGEVLQYLLSHYDASLEGVVAVRGFEEGLEKAMEELVRRLVELAQNINKAE